MTSVLETLSLKELYTRKKNLIFQLEKVDETIKKKLENEPDINIEITPYLNKDINHLANKIVIRKSINNDIQTSLENTQKGDDPSLTQKQILEICVVVNGGDPQKPKKKLESFIMETKFGNIILN